MIMRGQAGQQRSGRTAEVRPDSRGQTGQQRVSRIAEANLARRGQG